MTEMSRFEWNMYRCFNVNYMLNQIKILNHVIVHYIAKAETCMFYFGKYILLCCKKCYMNSAGSFWWKLF